MAGVVALICAPSASATEVVTYEIVSDTVASATVQYQDEVRRVFAGLVRLPWRADVVVSSVRGAPPQGSQVRADWRPLRAPNRWVSVRIIHAGEVICQTTLDIGSAACYGITQRIT
ncbi:hypothetical protein A5742_14740 [Mycolicibacterium fortuitum]|uniref:Uncharacterized protein n=2 Tax=Mycolicibacterium fortuitum TaxID=1766 RepID=A0ABD6QC98_MYCFO|nr:hypothetical protein [Mycolicibacterium fortuitum]OMC33146.1 hypothetical protein A5742_14740 [Mycolicibacterium fortuitum]